MPRARIMLENDEARPFDPFDRFAQVKESQGKSLEQLLRRVSTTLRHMIPEFTEV